MRGKNLDDDDVEMSVLLAPQVSAADQILNGMQAKQQNSFITDLFMLMATVIRERIGRIAERSDVAWDAIMRQKDLQIFIFSMIGVLCNITIACIFWYNDKTIMIDGVEARQDILLSEASPGRQSALYVLQLLLSISTIITCVIIAQKYALQVDEKRRVWSGIDTYDIVQFQGESEQLRMFNTSYTFWRSSLRWLCMVEILLQLVHPTIWMNSSETVKMYEIFEVIIFLRIYLVFRIVFAFSAEYKARQEIIASNAELQRSGFQVTMAGTMKRLFFNHPAKFVMCLILLSMCTLGFIVFILERSYQPQITQFGKLENCIWFTFVTFSTIGYGDMAPTSLFARLAAVLVGAVGITIATLFGGVVTNLMVQSREQRYVSEYLNIVKAGEHCRDSAARCIQAAWRYYRRTAGDINCPWMKEGHKSNFVRAAIKRFKSHRWIMSQSRSTANDPVIDSKMNRLGKNLVFTVRLLQRDDKSVIATRYNVESYLNDIVRLLEGGAEGKQ